LIVSAGPAAAIWQHYRQRRCNRTSSRFLAERRLICECAEKHRPREQDKYWLGLLWGVWRKDAVFSFAGLGCGLAAALWSARAVDLLLPVTVLCFGTTLFASTVLKMRQALMTKIDVIYVPRVEQRMSDMKIL
jgi:hypothetical protein